MCILKPGVIGDTLWFFKISEVFLSHLPAMCLQVPLRGPPRPGVFYSSWHATLYPHMTCDSRTDREAV